MKKVIGMALVIILCMSLFGCGVSDITDQMANVVQADDKNVLAVKGGTPNAYPEKTYGEAFEKFFGMPTWKYFVGTKEGSDEDGDGKPDYTEENVDIVEFTGYCTYRDVEVKALIQFTLDKEGGTFEATYLSFNDVPQTYFMLAQLIDTVFTSEDVTETEIHKDDENVTDSSSAITNEEGKEDDYALLNEFIDLICSFSDPPDYQGVELENYYKEQFDSWRRGEAYTNITEDGTGHLQIENHMSDFVGTWGDTYSQRCYMTIECTDGVYYYIDINWSDSAWENTHWAFVATYDSNSNGLKYYGSRCEEYYPDEGEMQETYVYDNGEGLIYLGDDGMVYWEDFVENQGSDCIFQRN